MYSPAISLIGTVGAMAKAMEQAQAAKRANDPGYVTTRKFCRPRPHVETIYRSPAEYRASPYRPSDCSYEGIGLGALVLGGLLFGAF